MIRWLRSRRRRKLLSADVPAARRAMLDAHVWQARHLPAVLRRKLEGWMSVFIAEHYWEGCGGLSLSDEMKISVAGQAGLMVLGYDDWYFDHTPSILIHPTEYTVKNVERPAGGGMTLVSDEDRAGEAWYRGPVVLAWPDVLAGGRSRNFGRNLVIHEFAHQLDMIGNRHADGNPPLPDEQSARAWDALMAREHRQLISICSQGRSPVLDCYGATNRAEFFAVASEAYFQNSGELAHWHPELFAALHGFYKLNVAQVADN